MAIPTTEDEDRTSKFSAVLKGAMRTMPQPQAPSGKRRAIPRWLVIGVVVAVVVGLGVAATVKSDLLISAPSGRQLLTEKVHKADLVVSVTEDGNVESAHNVDIKCEVKGGSTILWIIKDGTEVKEGDELIRLDDSSIEDQVGQQSITTEKAKATMIDAEKTFESAKIATQEYEQGTYQQQLKTLQVTETVAKENLQSAENLLQYYNRMARQGYVTALQRDAQAFAVQRSKLDLDVAEKAIEVLKEFTARKTLVSLKSAEASAEARMKSEDAAYKLEEDRLERLQTQLKKCTVLAPANGMVVYANEEMRSGRGGSSQQSPVEEGAMMRERQTMLRLPDLSRMQVKCTVHESKVDALERGMRARVRIQDHEFQGSVISVANQAEPSNWFMGNVKEYAAIVSIDSDPHGYGLRPGMTAAVEILVASLKGVLSVPVQAVVEKGGKYFCWVQTFSGPEKRPVVLGLSNNSRIEIKDGLNDGDQVLLNPRATVEEARADEKVEEDVDVKKRFGDDKPAALPAGGGDSKDKDGGKDGGKGGRSKGRGDLMQYDKDGDKKVSKDEAPEQIKNFFDIIDTNKDGFIDAKEAAAAAARRRQMEQQNGGGAGGPGGGAGGPPAPAP